MSFGNVLLALFLPPVYLYTRKKWIGGTITLIVWLLAWAMLVTVIAAIFSPIPYLIALFPAMWTLRREAFDEQATVLAQKIAEQRR
jgi:hypothetical protein